MNSFLISRCSFSGLTSPGVKNVWQHNDDKSPQRTAPAPLRANHNLCTKLDEERHEAFKPSMPTNIWRQLEGSATHQEWKSALVGNVGSAEWRSPNTNGE